MRDYLLQLKTQSIELWQKMTRVQKIIIGCSAVLLFGTLILLARGATKPDYGALFTQLDDQQAGQIVEKLKEKKIQYQISDGGSSGAGATILVPTKDIAQTRLELASEGMPTGGVVGFESFDNTKFGETDTDRRARYLRALQGELTRTIESMAEVEKARVHIVLPEPSLFLEEQKNATAAIMLKLKPNKTLDEGPAKGLVQLVTNSVEGLKPENVTVVDMAGNILSDEIGSDQESKDKKLSLSQIELQKNYQKELQNRAQTMLEKVFGVGKAVVRLELELNFDKVLQEKEEYDGTKVPRSQQKDEKTSTSNTATEAGAPGTDANIPGYVTPGETGNTQSSESSSITNYEVNKLTEKREFAPGTVKKLSVAVVVDKDLDTKEQKQVEDIVKGATGYDANRGDQISVAGMTFNTEYQDKMQSEIAAEEKRQQMMLYGGLAIVALLIIGGVVANIVLKKRRAREMEGVLQEEAAGAYSELTVARQEVPEEPVYVEPELTPEEKERKRMKEQVEKVAKDHPDDIAQLLRTWLAEE